LLEAAATRPVPVPRTENTVGGNEVRDARQSVGTAD